MDKMWAGRFSTALNPVAEDFNSSIRVDSKMYKQDIQGSLAHAALLAKKVIPLGGHINLIPLNDVVDSPIRPSGESGVKEFVKKLEALGVNVTVRRKLGEDIDAACGQLRRSVQQ